MITKDLIKIADELNSKAPGIYLIYNLSTEKGYIGSSKNIYRRWADHKMKLRKGIHNNPHLQASYNLYGRSRFIYHVIEHVQPDMLEERENFYLKSIDKETLYNLILFSERKLYSKEMADKISKARLGMKFTQRHRDNISKAKKGIPKSEEFKKQVSETMKSKGIIPKFKRKGIPLSESHKQKIGQANKGRVFTEEHKKKLSEAHKKSNS